MESTSFIELATALLAVLTPLVAVPLTVITFYLRSLREQLSAGHADLSKRMETAQAQIVEMKDRLYEFERDYTTKEEWLREHFDSRRQLDYLKEAVVRLDTLVQLRPGGFERIMLENPDDDKGAAEDSCDACPAANGDQDGDQ